MWKWINELISGRNAFSSVEWTNEPTNSRSVDIKVGSDFELSKQCVNEKLSNSVNDGDKKKKEKNTDQDEARKGICLLAI